jgi:SAM-dependent methyltransferase
VSKSELKLQDIVARELPPGPWAEGEKIPWNDPEFSARMLEEHLSQQHDMASRRQEMIERHVEWIHGTCLHGRPGRVLDLGCGPGFYAQRLARLGHACVGIDFSPASIEHARAQAVGSPQVIEYVCGDIRATDFGNGFDLVMLVFGELNVFTRTDAERLLQKACAALRAGGCLLLEPQTFDAIKEDGERPACWRTVSSGLFASRPHFWLEEHFWHDDLRIAANAWADKDCRRFNYEFL